MLWREGWLYQFATLSQLSFYACAAVGWLRRRRPSPHPAILVVPVFFCMVNIASLIATVNLALGRRITQWDQGRPGVGLARDRRAVTH